MGQTPTMPSTLRYGSGLMDVPVASVLPHLHVTGTVSGFFSSLGRRAQVDETGAVSGFGDGRDHFYTDGSVAVGLWDRAEMGVAVQSLGDSDSGGDVWGVFGRVRIWEPVDQGLGLAVGGRYLTSPSFGDGLAYAPGRLGFPDRRLRESYVGGRSGLDTNLTLYGVATAFVRGFDGGPLPENDMSFTLGYGSGMFKEGGDLDIYAPGHANGWFMGTALHIGMGQRTQLTVMAEHNGFDVNVGAHVDWGGLRLGAQLLATNHAEPVGGYSAPYEEPRFGLSVSVAICPRERGLRCRPTTMRRVDPDTIYIPPPPPDTVVIGRRAEPRHEVVDRITLCLSTGQNVSMGVSTAGDTVVASGAATLDEVRPGLGFAGTYAGEAFWYRDDRPITFEGVAFDKSADEFPMDCGQILRVGVHEGVPLFSTISARRPLDVLFVPVRPGVWRRYTRR